MSNNKLMLFKKILKIQFQTGIKHVTYSFPFTINDKQIN